LTTGGFELILREATGSTSTLTDFGSTSIAGITNTLTSGMVGESVVVDIYKPLQRYLTASLDKDGAGKSIAGPILAIQYKNHKGPVSQSTNEIIEAVTLISPTT
jgi:hypothetical protein